MSIRHIAVLMKKISVEQNHDFHTIFLSTFLTKSRYKKELPDIIVIVRTHFNNDQFNKNLKKCSDYIYLLY